jgi:Domain of unknown function (DUF1735)
MKKILSSSLILATLVVALTGCLKDKGFDNHTYGINDPDSQPPGVGFPLALNAKNTFGLDAGIATVQTINDVAWVNLEGGSPAKSDVHVTLVINDALRTAYNTANSANILSAAGFYNVALTLTIPAGATGANLPINVPSTVLMDPNNTYGVGLTITAVDGGYRIAENLKNLLVEITVKNKYDGIYSVVSGFVQRYTAPGAPVCCDGLTGPLGPSNPDVSVATAGSNRVQFIPTAVSAFGFTWSPGSGIGGIDAMYMDVDPATNNTTSFSTGANVTLGNFGGFPNAFVPPGTGPYGPPTANKYDPATKTFHIAFRWNPASTLREYDVVIKYKKARP